MERGFAEIAQNLTTFPDGTVAVCRSIDTMPAGIKGANKNGICIENVGNFDLGRDAMTPKQRGCIVNVFALLCKKFTLHPDSESILYHHRYDLTTGQPVSEGTGNTKSCPGTDFFGGNKVQDEETNFIPLVAQQLAAYSGVTVTLQPQAIYTADVQVDTLNVRALPSMSAAILKQLTRGIEVSIYEENNNWCRIDPVNSSWVDGRFLAATAAPVKVQALYAATVTPSVLNVRTAPSLSGSVSTKLTRGADVYVFEERDGWCRIDAAHSLWVDGSYLGRTYVAAA